MSDLVVTLPLSFRYGGKKGLAAWIAEGDAAGDPTTGEEYCFSVGGARPNISVGDRVYIVHARRLRGYAPLVELARAGPHYWNLWRAGGAVAVTVPEEIPGFRGWRYRWWDRAIEVPFPDWKSAGVSTPMPLFEETKPRPTKGDCDELNL